jgi:hypothetical protein
MNTASNWNNAMTAGSRPMTQKSDFKPSSSTKNLNAAQNQMFQTQTNLHSVQSMNALGRGSKTGT